MTLFDSTIQPTKTVYSLYFPEIRKIISNVTEHYPHETYLKSINPGLDDFHEQALLAYREHFGPWLTGLCDFKHNYYSAGASEAIFHILSHIRNQESQVPLYQLEGEYEGYAAYALNIGLQFITIKEDQDPRSLKPGIFFISNPSARDGNYLDPNWLNELSHAGHRFIMDLTYLGAAQPEQINLEHAGLLAVITSLSKPFGLYYYRIGFTFSKIPLPTLEANKWFKNILSCMIAQAVLTTIKPFSLYHKYKAYQSQIVQHLNYQFEIRVQASQVFFLSHCQSRDIQESDVSNLKNYRRGNQYRFCLSPYYMSLEAMK